MVDAETTPKRAAVDNPWYRLATRHGEPKHADDERADKNRETWNRWMAPRLPEELKAALRKKGWSDTELTLFSAGEQQSIAAQVGLPLEADWIDFSDISFEASFVARGFVFRDVDFSGATFSGYADFESATFSDSAHFERATFSGFAHFESATFSGFARFESATFSGSAFFSRATFSDYAASFGSATFSASAHFESSTFSDAAHFERATFGGYADFESATFSDAAIFGRATFSSSANFESATFSDDARFESATFSGFTANFESATFSGFTNFESSTFSSGANFVSTTFSREAGFESATFSSDANFVNAEMKGPTRFDDVKFSEPPRCFNAKLHEGTTWHHVHWPKTPSDPRKAEEFADAYERLKLEMDKLRKHGDELEFFARELQCRRVTEGRWKGLPIAVYGALSGYGRFYLRPLGLLVLTVIAGAIPLLLVPMRVGGSDFYRQVGATEAIGISFANTLSLLGKPLIEADVVLGLPNWLKAIATLQTALGIVLLFLFGLGIRNKFRMRG